MGRCDGRAGDVKASLDPGLTEMDGLDPQNFEASGGPAQLDLYGNGDTSFAFGPARPTRLAILFTPECTVDSAGSSTWLDLDIRVDGVAVSLSNTSFDAFYTSTGATVGTLDDWV